MSAWLIRMEGTYRRPMHSAVMHPSVAFVGAGPTTIYTLHALVSRMAYPFALTVFEEQAIDGRGTPYRPGWNDPAMLSNFSRYGKPVFVDDYATALHESIERMLALHAADRLALLELGDDYGIDGHRPEAGAILHPVADDIPRDRLLCLSLPFLLGRRPFSPGITSSHAMGLVVGEQLATALGKATTMETATS